MPPQQQLAAFHILPISTFFAGRISIAIRISLGGCNQLNYRSNRVPSADPPLSPPATYGSSCLHNERPIHRLIQLRVRVSRKISSGIRWRGGGVGEEESPSTRNEDLSAMPWTPGTPTLLTRLGKSSTIHFSLRLSPETRVEFFHSQATEVASIGTHTVYAQHI